VKRKALEFVVHGSQTAVVLQAMREAAGDALSRLTLAPLDGTPRYKVIALVEEPHTRVVMQAVMNALDKSG
jgi:hypothetical protein